MTVTLEALDAEQGDALLLRYEHEGEPVLWVIDGGPSGVYASSLRPRLDAIRAEMRIPEDGPLPIDLVMVTHIDGDHVLGVTDLFKAMKAAAEVDDPPPYAVRRAWHNAFRALVEGAGPASLEGTLARVPAPAEQGRAMIESAKQGSRLADLIRWAHLDGNPPFAGLVVAPRTLTDVSAGATVTVVAPTPAQLEALADQWEKEIEGAVDRGELAKIESYADNTASNLSSIVLLVEIEGRTLLLTGDGRGDHIMEGLEAAGRLGPEGTVHVDLLKVPHHGSDRNLALDFFERVTADHYVISADGQHDNPSTDTLEWIVTSQGPSRPYAIHLTHRDANGAKATLDALIGDATNVEVHWGRPDDARVTVTL